MDQIAENNPAKLIDARPELRVSQSSAWLRAYEQRQRFVAAIEAELARHNVKALVTRSVNGVYPPWLKVEAWLPDNAARPEGSDPRVRCEMQIIIDTRPYHEHDVVTTARADDGRKKIAVFNRLYFGEQQAAEWVAYTIQKGPKPSGYTPWQDRLESFFLAFIPFARTRHSNRIRDIYRNKLRFSGPGFLLIAGAVIAFVGSSSGIVLVLGLLVIAAALVILARRQKKVSVINTPDTSPRALLSVDSWQTVVPQLGERLADMKARILKALGDHAENGLMVEEETYGFRTPRGFEERDRIVVTKGQGVAQIHIYQFGKDIYVGWESFVNWAKWGETRAISALSDMTSIVEFRAVKEELYIPNQFDLIDLNSLSEVVHRDTSDVVKAMMKEFEIDQEIDFQIIRGDRDSALDKDRFDKRKNSERSTSTRRWSIR